MIVEFRPRLNDQPNNSLPGGAKAATHKCRTEHLERDPDIFRCCDLGSLPGTRFSARSGNVGPDHVKRPRSIGTQSSRSFFSDPAKQSSPFRDGVIVKHALSVVRAGHARVKM